jgi:hypothetical protein
MKLIEGRNVFTVPYGRTRHAIESCNLCHGLAGLRSDPLINYRPKFAVSERTVAPMHERFVDSPIRFVYHCAEIRPLLRSLNSEADKSIRCGVHVWN